YRATRSLPGLTETQVIGVSAGEEILVSVRDRGIFMDPRSQKDWWMGFPVNQLRRIPVDHSTGTGIGR
ncbi:MAG: hypothetical protein AAF629_27075, partial [Chloroflexota bacterium]